VSDTVQLFFPRTRCQQHRAGVPETSAVFLPFPPRFSCFLSPPLWSPILATDCPTPFFPFPFPASPKISFSPSPPYFPCISTDFNLFFFLKSFMQGNDTPPLFSLLVTPAAFFFRCPPHLFNLPVTPFFRLGKGIVFHFLIPFLFHPSPFRPVVPPRPPFFFCFPGIGGPQFFLPLFPCAGLMGKFFFFFYQELSPPPCFSRNRPAPKRQPHGATALSSRA